jgi:deoxyribodipyrimidine photo-lyase
MSHHADGLVWMRRDLRLSDHAALSAALADCRRVRCVFVFDRTLLDPLIAAQRRQDRRVEFIRESLLEVDAELRSLGGALIVLQGDPTRLIPELARQLSCGAVYVAEDYEPAARLRDAQVAASLQALGAQLVSCKDQVIFHKSEVLTGAGQPFSVFTPYLRAWQRLLGPPEMAPALAAHDTSTLADRLAPAGDGQTPMPALEQLGFAPTNLRELGIVPGMSGAGRQLEEFLTRIDCYDRRRDFPGQRGPSYLSVHLRFGTLSIRALMRAAAQHTAAAASAGAQTWVKELVWREFYAQILYHRPDVVESAFRAEYNRIEWERGDAADEHFRRWCEGSTGYPIVDAAMLQLNGSGYMHNRLRMISASFLVKDLGIDWRRGADYFALHLNDFDLASNNGGWQWAASTGCDAQPYFRIFNPVTQSERFDAEGSFIGRYLEALRGLPAKSIHSPWTEDAATLEAHGVRLGDNYPRPVVDHAQARERTLARFASARAARH